MKVLCAERYESGKDLRSAFKNLFVYKNRAITSVSFDFSNESSMFTQPSKPILAQWKNSLQRETKRSQKTFDHFCLEFPHCATSQYRVNRIVQTQNFRVLDFLRD